MFCKRTYCALILMMETALAYSSNSHINLDFVSHKHTIPPEEFDGIIEKLNESKLILVVNDKLQLMTPPDKITVWQIVISIAADSMFTGRYFSDEQHVTPTSTVTMLHKEREIMLQMIENRLRRQKLSTWSERASKTIYI